MTTENANMDVFGTPAPVETPAVPHLPAAVPAAGPATPTASATGLQAIRWGEKRDASPIAQYKGQANRVDMIGIVDSAQVAYSHFDKGGFGRMFCFKGICCDKLGMPSVHYIIPIVHYDTYLDETETLVFRSNKMKFEFMRIDREKYDFFANIARAGNDPTMFDYVVSCSDTQYQKLVFNQVQGREAAWRTPELQERVLAKYAQVKKFIEPSLGKTVTEAEFKAKHGIGVTPGPTITSSQLTDLV